MPATALPAKLGAAVLLASAVFGPSFALAQGTSPDSSSPQPTLPKPIEGIGQGTPELGGGGKSGAGTKGKPLTVRKEAHRRARHRHQRHYAAAEPVERPALAGVQLLENLPHPIQPPHIAVPTPAYPLENFATFYTTPPPPVICHRAPRDPYVIDPHLLYEKPVICEADNP